MSRRFLLYLTAIGLASLATGIQLVMLPWLAAGQLQLPAGQVGWVQSAQLLPGAALMLLSGAMSDRRGSDRWLPLYYLAMFSLHLLMLWVILTSHLTLLALMIYGVLLGAVFTFIQPLRDRILPRLVGEGSNRLQHGVVLVSMCVYVGQAVGVALSGQMESLGISTVFAVQCACLLFAALLYGLVLKNRQAMDGNLAENRQSSSTQLPAQNHIQPTIQQGLQYLWRHPVLRHLIVLVSFNGFMNLGVFLVALPLLARDVYLQDAAFFSILQLAFVIGNVASTVGLLRSGHVERPGRAVLFCLLYSAVIMLAISAGPTETGLLILVFAWGTVAGVSSNMGKALLQQQVTDRYRGRVLSIYFLALLGSAPLGALFCGYIMDSWGGSLLFQLSGYVSLGLFVLYLRASSLWQKENS